MKNIQSKNIVWNSLRVNRLIVIILVLVSVLGKYDLLAQTKSVVVSQTLTSPTGLNYHALENMTLDAGFIYDSNTSGLFYVETGDFVNPEPSYGNDRNKVVTEIARDSTASNSTLSSWGNDKKHTTIQYTDGLGRRVQSIYQQGSPLGKDMIQHFEYDQQGRGSKAFLPYVGTTTNGSFHASASTEQLNFYDNSSDDIADSDYPFAETDFDDSPLNRVLKLGAPGEDWQLSSGNTPEFEFRTNDASEIRKFNSDGTSTTYWGADLLSISETTDENDHMVEQYTDEFGRLILKKVEQDSAVWSWTYHIYDDMGRLKYTIQPEGYEKMVDDSNYNVSHVEDDYVFTYNYDDRGRLVEKEVPGADPVYFIYDKLDRVVLTQDGILRANNKWNFTKYDIKNRVVSTGFHTDNTNTTRASKQTDCDAVVYDGENHYEESNSSTHGYTSRAYPTTGTNSEQIFYYYDDYNFDGLNEDRDYNYESKGYGNVVDYGAINRLTGMKQKILDGSDWLWDIYFYDRKGRPIQTRSNNELQTSVNDANTTKYHFDGRIEKSNRYVDGSSGNTVDVENRYVYDNAGRLTEVYQEIDNSGTEFQVAEYDYNELGQLVEKHLYEDGTDFLQSVDYRYNIRGWMTKINGSDLATNGINSGDDYDDIFGMDLLYNTTETGINNTSFYNGNISAVKWQTNDPSSEGIKRERSYAFSYDRSDRLTDATFKAYNGTNWTTEEQGSYDVTGISYDKNGNIQGLNRYYQEDETSGRSTIDSLIYTYSANRLTKVEDSGDDNIGFKEGTGQTTEYTYDSNGNILTDTNKDLTYTYNDLNKTKKVQYNANKYIEYTYSSSGARIKKRVYDSGNSIDETWHYIKGFVFKGSAIDHFAMNEGVVRKVNGDYQYEYFLTDHQGNTRMSFTADQEDIYLATMEDGQATVEEALFHNVSETRHTDGMFIVQTGSPNAKLSYMDGTSEEVGLAKSLKVAKGDVVSMTVWSKYSDVSCGGSCNTVDEDVITTALASLFGGVSGGGGEAQDIYEGIEAGVAAIFGSGGHGSGGSGSKVFMNWLLFDENYDLVNQGFEEASTSISQLDLTIPTITETGYVFAYLSNESGGTQKGYFDHFEISHTRKISVLQENHYYPFGMELEGVAVHVPSPSNNSLNKYLYNQGSEQQELDIRNYDTPFRQYDPALGRFQAVDPLADYYSNQTPYQYGNNDPIYWSDPTGLGGYCGVCFTTLVDGLNAHHDDGAGGILTMSNARSAATGGFYSTLGGITKRQYGRQNHVGRVKMYTVRGPGGPIGSSAASNPSSFFNNSRFRGFGAIGNRGHGPDGPGFAERGDFASDVYGGPNENDQDHPWFDEQGEILFNHWRNGNGRELNLDSEKWGDYMRSRRELMDAIEEEISRLGLKESGDFSGDMHGQLNVPNLYRTGHQMLNGTNFRVGDLQYSGHVEITNSSDGQILNYNVVMTWNDIMDANENYIGDKIGAAIFPGTSYTVRITWAISFTHYRFDD